MIRSRLLLVALAALVFGGCDRPDTVDLSYRFQQGSELRYRLEARASAQWDIGEPGDGSYEVTFEVTERVESAEDESSVVAVVMTPVEVVENGLPSPGSEETTFSLRLDEKGEVLEVIEVQGVPAAELDAAQLAFIGTYRPPLPDEGKGLQDIWKHEQDLETGAVRQETQAEGRVVHLARDADGRVAELEFAGHARLFLSTALAQGRAEMSGRSQTSIDALLDIDGGYLRRASSATEGDFTATLPAEGTEPVTGTLHLELDLELERL